MLSLHELRTKKEVRIVKKGGQRALHFLIFMTCCLCIIHEGEPNWGSVVYLQYNARKIILKQNSIHNRCLMYMRSYASDNFGHNFVRSCILKFVSRFFFLLRK